MLTECDEFDESDINVKSNKNYQISDTKFPEEHCVYLLTGDVILARYEIPSYDVAVNTCKSIPLASKRVSSEDPINREEEFSTENLNIKNEQMPKLKMSKEIEEIKELLVIIKLGTQKQAEEALTKLTNFTLTNKSEIIEARAVPMFIKYLDITKIGFCKIAIQAMANMSEGTNEQKHAIFVAEGILPLIHCLHSTDFFVQATAAFALANIINDNETQNLFDQKLIKIFKKFLKMINSEDNDAESESAVQRLNIFIQILPLLNKLLNCNYIDICKFAGSSLLKFINDTKYKNDEIQNCELRNAIFSSGTLQYFIRYLHSDDEELCKIGVMVLRFAASGTVEQKQEILNANVVPLLVNHLLTLDKEKCFEALKVLSKIVNGTNEQKQVVIDAEACPLFVVLLNSPFNEISFEALNVLASISAGNLNQQKAIVEAGCISELIQFLNIENVEKCDLAMVILFNIINGNPERNSILIKYGGVPFLKKLITVTDKNIQLLALRILECISAGSSKNKQAIIQAFAINPMVNLLETETSKDNAYKIITNILVNIAFGTSEQRQAIIDAGGIPHFCKMLQSTDTELIKDIVKIFAIISGSPQRHKIITEINVVPSLASLLKFSNDFIVEHCLETLQNITSGGTKNQNDAIFAIPGAIPMLIYLCYSSNPLICEHALGVIANLLLNVTIYQKQVLIDADIIQVSIHLLSSANAKICINALNILQCICSAFKEQIQAEINGGAIPVLQKLLKSDDNNVSKSSSIVLHKLINANK
uniref:Uncharacterized protein n=1 Tax=Panagrolaimus sp. ES5 TaxID=591445 RepID=A0AC34FPI6_9BILA